jgi:molybdate transport system substrate-binding protein
MATRHLLADLIAAASFAGLGDVDLESVGGADAEQRVAAGEKFDLVFLSDGALRRLADLGHVDAASVTPLVLSQTAMAVPSDSLLPAPRPEKPAFPDANGVRAALRAARSIGYSTGPSGTALVRLIEEWGLTQAVGDRLVQARPGIPVASSLAARDVDIGFQQLSELIGQPGVGILGVLPDDCAIETVFGGAVASACDSRDRAAATLEFLASRETAAKRDRYGFRSR